MCPCVPTFHPVSSLLCGKVSEFLLALVSHCSLRAKLTHAFALLKNYQHKVRLSAAGCCISLLPAAAAFTLARVACATAVYSLNTAFFSFCLVGTRAACSTAGWASAPLHTS